MKLSILMMHNCVLYHCWSELGDGRDIKRTKCQSFIASLLRAAHALVLAAEVSIPDRKCIQRYIVCISMIGWVVSACSKVADSGG